MIEKLMIDDFRIPMMPTDGGEIFHPWARTGVLTTMADHVKVGAVLRMPSELVRSIEL